MIFNRKKFRSRLSWLSEKPQSLMEAFFLPFMILWSPVIFFLLLISCWELDDD